MTAIAQNGGLVYAVVIVPGRWFVLRVWSYTVSRSHQRGATRFLLQLITMRPCQTVSAVWLHLKCAGVGSIPPASQLAFSLSGFSPLLAHGSTRSEVFALKTLMNDDQLGVLFFEMLFGFKSRNVQQPAGSQARFGVPWRCSTCA